MSALAANRVQENSTLTGTGAIMLAGATNPAMNTFASAFADGALCGYIVLNLAVQTEWEQGIGTYNAGANTIARTYVVAGSNGTSPVNFSAGAKMVLNAPPPSSAGAPYSATQVYSPGDTCVSGGTTWYALAVSKGSTPATGNPNWAAMGGGGGGGSGTVTSVGLSVPAWLAVSGSPVTTAGTLALQAATGQPANKALMTPNGAAGPVSLRSIVEADISISDNTTGNASTSAHGFAPKLPGDATKYLDGSGNFSTPDGPSADPYYADVLALLDLSSDAIVDAKGNAWTSIGSYTPKVGRFFNLGYSKRSCYLGFGAALTSSAVAFGGTSTPWTIEGWFYRTSSGTPSTTQLICGQSTNSGLFLPNSISNGGFSFFANSTDKYVIKAAAYPTIGQHHYVLQWDGTTLTLALDGQVIGTATKQFATANGQFYLGGDTSGDYFSDFLGPHRITNGVARNNFNIPTTTFPAF